MSRCPGWLALLFAVLPATAWSQQCTKPVLPDTEIEGWHRSELGGVIVGTARYSIASPNAGPNETFTLGISFSHAASDESHDLRPPDHRALSDLMTSSLQFRDELKDRTRPRTWDTDAVRVMLDGKPFPGRFDVQGSPGRDHALAINWEVWYSDENLMDALENAREVEIMLRHTPTGTFATRRFDVSSFKGIRSKLIPYWRCTATPFHTHRH
jgi:hypothetical protein